MIRINDNFCKLPGSYLFSEVARRVETYKKEHPEADIIRMGIGDVTRPLIPSVVKAMKQAVCDQSKTDSFHGYGPEQGYAWLREAIAKSDYISRGVDIDADEIFISDGAKSDTGNIGDILSAGCRIAVTDPVYPVYIDTNVMSGRAGNLDADGRWSKIVYLPCTEQNNFVPDLPSVPVDVVYLCYPNNPTGTALTRQQLKVWVDYALKNDILIMYDCAYEAFITSEDVPHSIYEIEGAKKVAIEFRSFSKTAGFTGVRCGYSVVPKELVGLDSGGHPISLHALWLRRQTTKFNGASYISQRGAQALYSPEGAQETKETINYYMRNARAIREGMDALGLKAVGGVDSPYIWVKAIDGMSSWQMFDFLLDKAHVVSTPGCGFGPSGEGYIRLTAFNTFDFTKEAVERIAALKL